MVILYEIVYILAFICYLPILILKGKWHDQFWTRFGIWPRPLASALKEKKNIWVHAVSVGEVLAVQGLVKRLKEQAPSYHYVISTVTAAGYQLARSKFPEDSVIYAPLDFGIAVYRYIHFIRPKMYIATETEIWPNLFEALHAKGVPVAVVNGRISGKSFGRYRSIRFFLKGILTPVKAFCVQTPEDKERLAQLGVPAEKIHIAGNLKFEDAPPAKGFGKPDLGFAPTDLVWVAGSTHPGEEGMILEIVQSLTERFPDLRLILAPRHIERAPEIIRLTEQKGFEPRKFSQIKTARFAPKTVVVVDTIGDLRSLYGIADVVFVGKSLVGHGGQNIIEPAFWGKAIIVGAHMENFKDVFAMFAQQKAAVQVHDQQELSAVIEHLLADPKERERLGTAAKSIVEKNQGATQRTVDVILKIFNRD